MKLLCVFSVLCMFSFIHTSGFWQQDRPQDPKLRKLLSKADSLQNINPDSSFFYSQKALTAASLPKDISEANQYIGRYYIQKEDFGKALSYFLSALKIEEVRNDERRIADIFDDLGNIYVIMEKFDKALVYNNKSLLTSQKLKDTLGIAKSLSHIGVLHLSREFCQTRTNDEKAKDYTIAIGYFNKSLELSKKIGNEIGVAKNNVNLGNAYNKLGQPEKALQMITKSLEYYKKVDDWNGITETLSNLGQVYNRLKQYQKAIGCFSQCIAEGKKRNLTQGIQYVYEAMSQTYDNAKDYKHARDSYVKYMIIRDSIYNSEKSKQIFELDAQYQAEKKKKEILRLTVAKRNRELFIYILALVVIVLIFIYLNIQNKRKITQQALDIKEQKIFQMEKDRQLVATQSVLQGEEAERSRMARDLHDGLGGLLSGVKLSLSNMKGNMVLSTGSLEKFDHALSLLDTSIRELRRVAHNMMPGALVNFGLREALSDFCSSINNNTIHLNFQFFGVEKRIDPSFEINTFRIAQELINNALKHSNSTELMIQLIQEEKRVHLTVQDNGKGFDTSHIASGTGLNNIKSRVESLKGSYDLVSEQGKGTEVTVEFTWEG